MPGWGGLYKRDKVRGKKKDQTRNEDGLSNRVSL